jgi:hypothetical protein
MSSISSGGLGLSNVFNFIGNKLSGAVVNNALQVGLMQLAPLKNAGGLLDWRISNLRDLIRKKQNLGLIFPEEDLLFRYRTANSSSFADHSGASKQSLGQKATQLVMGGRVPHVWLTLFAEGYYLSALGLVNEEFTQAVTFSNKLADLSEQTRQHMETTIKANHGIPTASTSRSAARKASRQTPLENIADGVGDDVVMKSHASLLKQYIDYLRYLVNLDMRVIASLRRRMDIEPIPVRTAMFTSMLTEIKVKCQIMATKLEIIDDVKLREEIAENVRICIENVDAVLEPTPLVLNTTATSSSAGSVASSGTTTAQSSGDRNEYYKGLLMAGSGAGSAHSLFSSNFDGLSNSKQLSFTLSATHIHAVVPNILATDLQSRHKLHSTSSKTITNRKPMSSPFSNNVNAISTGKPPMFVLMVPIQYLHQWIGAIGLNGLKQVVTVIGVCTEDDSSGNGTETSAVHDVATESAVGKEIQKQLKSPTFNLSHSTSANGMDSTAAAPSILQQQNICLLKHYELYESLRNRSRNTSFIDGLAHQNLLHFKDVTGEWKKACQQFVAAHNSNKDNSGNMINSNSGGVAVLVRPDGHIAGITHAVVNKADMDLFLSEHRKFYSLKTK